MSDEQIDCYRILQVHPEAEPETITQIYRLLARKYHPDIAPANLKSSYEEKLKQINLAYETIGKPEARQRYNATSSSETDINSYQVQFEIAAVLAETANVDGGQYRCYKQSEEILKGIIKNNSDRAVIYKAFVRLAQIQYHGLGSYGNAAESFDKLLSMTTERKERDDLFYYITKCHIKSSDCKLAVSSINRLLAECKDPKKIRGLEVTRGDLFRDMPDHECALDAYKIVTIKYSGSEEAAFCHFQRARILDSNLNKWHDAMAEYRIVMDKYSQYQWASDCKWRIDHIQRKHIEKKSFWET